MVKIGEQADLSGFGVDESIPTDTENRWDGQPRDSDGKFDKGSKGGKKFRISRKEKSSESPKKSNKGVEKSAESGIIRVKNSELKNGLPIKGKPNSIVDKLDDNGKTLQRRIYDDEGKAKTDYDTTDHNLPSVHPMGAHKHNFDYNKKKPRSKPLYLDEKDLEDNSDIIQRGDNYHDKI